MDSLPHLVQHRVSPTTGQPCCYKAIKSGMGRDAMQAYINSFKIPRKSTALVRTGCIPCLEQRVKCDGTHPRCRKASITDAWRINSNIIWHGQRTWRERKGIHCFINFALAPERTGLFESVFWHKTVVQACFSSDAVFYVGSAVGALLEYQLSANSGLKTSDGLAFALQQCNRAITLLTTSARNSQRAYHDPGIVLITCVLFAIFEALHGECEEAIKHALQGRKLLRNCETLASKGQGSLILNPMAVSPVIGCLEIQAKALQGRKMEVSDQIEEPSMPDIERIHSLEHANWTLHYGYVSLLAFCQHISYAHTARVAVQMQQKHDVFVPWLHKWEQSFAEYLFREASYLTPWDMQRGKVLKANHLVATMIASTDARTWAYHDEHCKAIIDLSTSVLDSCPLGSHAAFNSFHFPYLTFGLWVTEPLFIVMSRSRNAEIRLQAANLLNSVTRPLQDRRTVFRQAIGFRLDTCNIKRDTDEWDTEQWIEFCMNTRLDAAMATYFARLPSEQIEKPAFRQTSP